MSAHTSCTRPGHRLREPVQGRPGAEHVGQGVGVHRRHRGRIEGAAQAFLEVEGRAEGLLQRDLLVQHHGDEQGQRVVGEEPVHGGVAGHVDHRIRLAKITGHLLGPGGNHGPSAASPRHEGVVDILTATERAEAVEYMVVGVRPTTLQRPPARRREAERDASPIGVSDGIVLFVVLVAGALLRLWMLGHANMNSDEAIVGLMAHQIVHGHTTTFYWGRTTGAWSRTSWPSCRCSAPRRWW